jgi:pimeloyl-ACP methyl ester carboxylesterase
VTEEVARIGDIDIAYETFGSPDDPALLLVMGLGVQMLGWDTGMCRMWVDRGFHVIRFDNRDVGHSSQIEGGPPPNPLAAIGGDHSTANYTLDDMADDAVGLLDHLGIDAAHVAGVSMGGMIAQTIAIKHPERVLSLASIMSTTGDLSVGQARPEVIPVLLTPQPAEKAGFVEQQMNAFRVIGSPGFDRDEDRIRALLEQSFDRCYSPAGFARQLVGILASGDRTGALANVDVPTLVIHGADDPLIQPSGGDATARAIPGAELVVIPGMGHDLPSALWPQIVDAVARNAARAAEKQPELP